MVTMQKAAIIIPCYNEEQRLDVVKIKNFAADNPHISFIMVDDGSRDKTAEIITTLAKVNNKQIFALNLPENKGKAEAVRQGFRKAFSMEYEFIGFWDADLATPLYEINNLYKYLSTRQSRLIAFGSRVRLLDRNIGRKPTRHYLGRLFATMASFILSVHIYDTQCGAKLFRHTRLLQEVFNTPFSCNWIFDVEIFARFIMLQRGTTRTLAKTAIEHPLMEWQDVPGSKLKSTDFLKAFVELLKIIFFLYAPGRNKRRMSLSSGT